MNKELFNDKFYKSLQYIHEVKIFNEIQNYKNILIFDFRRKEEFDKHRIENSINLPFDKYDYSFFETLDEAKIKQIAEVASLNEETRNMLKRHKRYYIALIISEEKIKRAMIESCEKFDSDDIERERIIKCLLFYNALVKNRVYELGLYNKGFKKFEQHYYYLVSSIDKKALAR
jgi:hypothetical protein